LSKRINLIMLIQNVKTPRSSLQLGRRQSGRGRGGGLTEEGIPPPIPFENAFFRRLYQIREGRAPAWHFKFPCGRMLRRREGKEGVLSPRCQRNSYPRPFISSRRSKLPYDVRYCRNRRRWEGGQISYLVRRDAKRPACHSRVAVGNMETGRNRFAISDQLVTYGRFD